MPGKKAFLKSTSVSVIVNILQKYSTSFAFKKSPTFNENWDDRLRMNCSLSGTHDPEPTTLLCSCNGVFTD